MERYNCTSIMKNVFIALLALIGLGCSYQYSSPMLTMHADVDFMSAERDCLEKSADKWREQTSDMGDVRFVYDYQPKSLTSVIENRLKHRVVRWTSDMAIVKAQDT